MCSLGGLKKANGPKNNKKKNFVTHLMTMLQAAGKNRWMGQVGFKSQEV